LTGENPQNQHFFFVSRFSFLSKTTLNIFFFFGFPVVFFDQFLAGKKTKSKVLSGENHPGINP